MIDSTQVSPEHFNHLWSYFHQGWGPTAADADTERRVAGAKSRHTSR